MPRFLKLIAHGKPAYFADALHNGKPETDGIAALVVLPESLKQLLRRNTRTGAGVLDQKAAGIQLHLNGTVFLVMANGIAEQICQ